MIHKTIIPSKREVKVSFNVPDNYIGAEMEVIAFVKDEALEQTDDTFMSPALPGSPMNNKAFLKWIEQAESVPTYSLQEAKQAWEIKKKQLQNLIK